MGKHALLIGNDKYSRQENRLIHSINNARKLGELLCKINFTVTEHENLAEEDQIIEQVISFAKTLKNGDMVFCYFSSHALQFNGNNYLIPANDTAVHSDQDIEVFGVNLKRMIDRLSESKPDCVFILIFDCCRPYSFYGGSSTTATTSKSYPSHDFVSHLYVFI